MVFSARRNGSRNPGLAPPTSRRGFSTQHTSDGINNIIAQPVYEPAYDRRVITWRLPQLGYVKMFINPQNIVISDSKDISTVRTKAGFVIQYAGEQLTEIRISGVTGSAGQEGINILRAIYRSEQIAFEAIADELDRSVLSVQASQLSRGIVDNFIVSPTQNANNDLLRGAISDANNIALNLLSQPFPTLASLAANVEMFFQGVTYRGYFKTFSVTEAADTTGNLSYDISFTAYAKQGERRNFMPWHRQPYNPVGADASPDVNPLSFQTPFIPFIDTDDQEQLPSSSDTSRTDDTSVDLSNRPKFETFGVGLDGASLSDVDLEDEV